MNLNRGLGIKLIDSVESCEKYIRAYYQGNINKCVKDYQNIKDIQDTNKRIYFTFESGAEDGGLVVLRLSALTQRPEPEHSRRCHQADQIV